MFWKKFTAIFISVLLVFISACNLPAGSAITGAEGDSTAAIQTQVAGLVGATAAAQTALANAVAETLAGMVTDTPEFTFTPSLTPTPSFTLTPTAPMVSVSTQTNCRSGPGLVYDKVGVLEVGETAEVVAKASGIDYWIIRNPDSAGANCWLWGQYATVSGNTAGLPTYTPPPTPTPAAAFTVTFLDTTHCAPDYAFQFQVTNTGSITWESINIVITDNTASTTTTTHTLDSFRSYEGCALEMDQLNLDPGEGGHVSNINPGQLNYNPSGNQFTAVFKLCSENGLAGTCLTKTINFTP